MTHLAPTALPGTLDGDRPAAVTRRRPRVLAALGLAAAALLAPAVAGVGLAGTASAAAGTVYYVDPAGSDAAPGTSPNQAWQSLRRVNTTTLNAGDMVLLKRGGTWTGRLRVAASGVAGAPIVVGGYGTGARPTLTGGANGSCLRVDGDYVVVDNIRATECGYAGFDFAGDRGTLIRANASNNQVGVKVSRGSSFGTFKNNTVVDNNRMTVLTQGIDCGTSVARFCSDDSGSTGFVINGDDNEFAFNNVSGSNSFSYDYGRDGSAFEIYDGNRNSIHDNTSVNNLVLSEIGRSSAGTADGNEYRNNVATADCGVDCDNAGGITLRGPKSVYGPNNNTVIDGNTIRLVGKSTHPIACHADCPSSTVITNNVLSGTRAIWMDGSGWSVFGNVFEGATTAVIGTQRTVYSG